MYIFIIKPNVNYAGGCVLVAARNIDEAVQTYTKEEYANYLYETLNCSTNYLSHCDCDCSEPKIIVDTIYSE